MCHWVAKELRSCQQFFGPEDFRYDEVDGKYQQRSGLDYR